MSRNAVRSIDLLCRYTDDSFAILLLMTARADARHVAERLRNGIAGLDIANGKGPLRITASLGVSAYPRDGCSSIFDLLAIAQEAQRAAQHGGGNQIVYV
jgi:diguanylate cyclase (GGDEF)-like protein